MASSGADQNGGSRCSTALAAAKRRGDNAALAKLMGPLSPEYRG